MAQQKLNCTTCASADVCVVIRTFAPALKNIFPDPDKKTPAIRVEDLATICRAYTSSALVQTIKTAEQQAATAPAQEAPQ